MTSLQALLIALLGYLGSIYGTSLLGTAGGQDMIGRPVVARAPIGLILGDIKNGVLTGATIQALYVGLVTSGMSVPGDVNFAPCIGIPLALVSNASPEYAVGTSVPLSPLEVAAVYNVATFNTIFVHLQDRWIEGGRLEQAARIPTYSNISQFVVRFIPIFLACCFGADYVPKMIALIPDQLGITFQVLGGILPAVSFALLIKFALKKNIELLYALIGFIVMAVLKMPVVAITALIVFITYLDYLRCMKQSQGG